jgi:hypothetical protein
LFSGLRVKDEEQHRGDDAYDSPLRDLVDFNCYVWNTGYIRKIEETGLKAHIGSRCLPYDIKSASQWFMQASAETRARCIERCPPLATLTKAACDLMIRSMTLQPALFHAVPSST